MEVQSRLGTRAYFEKAVAGAIVVPLISTADFHRKSNCDPMTPVFRAEQCRL